MARMARPYTSRLRSEQAAQTRRKVVEAAATVLARDLGDFTIPGVAVEAGVSAATVERLFTNKCPQAFGLRSPPRRSNSCAERREAPDCGRLSRC